LNVFNNTPNWTFQPQGVSDLIILMRLKFECLAGPRKGDQFTIRDEITIGRKAELALRDPKSSAEHARIVIDSNGLPVLEDLGSANGTKLNGKKIKEPMPLREGDEIRIGSTQLKVLEVRTELPLEEEVEAAAPTMANIQDDWARTIENLLLKSQPSRKKLEVPKPFNPSLEVVVKKGLAAGQSFHLGFGPRRFGAWTSDVLLVDEIAPDLAFEIIPQDNGSALFKTGHPEKVLLNKESEEMKLLQDGDLLQIGQMVLQIKISEVL